MLIFGIIFNPSEKMSTVYPSTKLTDFLKKDGELFRIATISNSFESEDHVLIPNSSMIYHIQSVEGYTALFPQRYYHFINRISGKMRRPGAGPVFLKNVIYFPKTNICRGDKIKSEFLRLLLGLLNVKYVLSTDDIEGDELKLAFVGDDVKVYENLAVLPRAFMVYGTKVLKEDEIFHELLDTDYNPKATLILEDGVLEEQLSSKYSRTNNQAESDVRIIKYSANKIKLEVSSTDDGFLFLSDTYYPGWQVLIDSKESKIYRANYTFRAVYLSKGEHHVEFVYAPKSLRIGLIVSAIAFGAGILLLFSPLQWWRKY